jgi:hypothetical protein
MAGLLLTLAFAAHAGKMPSVERLDDFSHPEIWKVSGTDDISASLTPVDGKTGRALCVNFNFHGVSGGVTLHRALPISFPANYALSFDVRGAMPANDLQLRLVDASGDNVWWYRHEAFQPSDSWQTIKVGKPDIDFAWGTTKDKMLRESSALEFTVYAGRGGKGELCFSNLRLTPLPVTAASEQTTPTDDPNKSPLIQQARQATRGMYPRGLSGEQSYWTLVGVDGGAPSSALMSEDGAIEVGKGGWSIEPMLFDGHSVIDWATVKTQQKLLDGYLPIPTVRWQVGGLSLETTAFANGTPKDSKLFAQYRLHNEDDRPRTLTLALLVRPFQVNPPTQFLNMKSGISPIHDLDWSGRTLRVNHSLQIVPLQAPTAFVASPHGAVTLPEQLASGTPAKINTGTERASLHDDTGFAQGAMFYRLTVPAHGDVTLGLVVPSLGVVGEQPSFVPPPDATHWLQQQQDQTAAVWREKLNRVTLQLPAAQQAIADTARSTLAPTAR